MAIGGKAQQMTARIRDKLWANAWGWPGLFRLFLVWGLLVGFLGSALPFVALAQQSSETPAGISQPLPVTASLSALPPSLVEVYENRRPPEPSDIVLMDEYQRELVERLRPCVVALQIGQAQGSGVIVSSDGLILTAAHVIQRPGLPVRVTFFDGEQAEGVTLGMDRGSDAGMARIKRRISSNPDSQASTAFAFAPVADSSSLTVGQWVIALGHPGGYQAKRKPVVRIGRVLSVNDETIVTDGPLVGGDSGGPLFNMKGEVVGIHSRIGNSLQANMHVATKSFQVVWDRLLAGKIWGEVPRGAPYIGVRGDPDSQEARIAEVEPGQPADKAGIKVGDVVVEFGGQEIRTFSDLVSRVAESTPGEVVKVVVRRDEQLIELDLVIGRKR